MYVDAEPPRRTRQACKHAMAVDDPPLLVLLVLLRSTTQRPDRIGSLAPISSFLGFHAFSLLANFILVRRHIFLADIHSFASGLILLFISLLVEDAGVFRRSSIALR